MSSFDSRIPIGVVLFNLGGPDSLDAVRPFLYQLFSDPNIFRFPLAWLFRKPLAWLIAKKRAPKSRVYFEAIGGKSPLKELTLEQARNLESQLNKDSKTPFKVVVAMRYWKPSTDDAIDQLVALGVKKVVLLPLYPQYSFTTTRSSDQFWQKRLKKRKIRFEKVLSIHDYHKDPLYIRAVCAQILTALEDFSAEERENLHLVFSAHGIPMSEIKRGDPYQKQTEASVQAVIEELRQSAPFSGCAPKFRLGYQSRVGPLKWLTPTTVRVLEQLAKDGVKSVIAVPISFVSDHSETLYELKKLYGELATKLGIEKYRLMPALNSSPLFIEALRNQVLGICQICA